MEENNNESSAPYSSEELSEITGGTINDMEIQPVEIEGEETESEESSTTEEIPEHVVPVINVNPMKYRESTARFSSASWFEEASNNVIILAGLGGIGSWTALLLSRLRPQNITLYDGDVVEEVNMAGQLFKETDIGETKVSAVANTLRNYSGYWANTTRWYTESSLTSNIMICGFDNMSARKLFYKNWKRRVEYAHDAGALLYIDGRMAAEEFQVYCLVGNDSRAMENYEKTLFSDDEAEETICSYKQTTYMAAMIGAVISNLYVNFCANRSNLPYPRDLPYLTEYDGRMMYFKTTA